MKLEIYAGGCRFRAIANVLGFAVALYRKGGASVLALYLLPLLSAFNG